MASASAQDPAIESTPGVQRPDASPPGRFVEVTDAVAGVKGWMTPGQARLLWRSARVLDPGQRIVEIGSFQGRSTIVLASGAPKGAEVVAIDPHAGHDRGPNEIEGFANEAESDHQIFNSNLAAAGVAERVRHVREFSDAALDEVEGPIDLLYIDGAHRFAPARDDIVAWGARVVPGGTMLIHDSFNALGVTLAQAAVLFASGEFRYVGRSESMAEYRRERLGPLRRITNLGRQVGQLPYFAWCQLVKVLITLKLGALTRLIGNPSGEWPY